MDEAFEKMKKQGKTDVESLVKWMKDSKIIDSTKATEEKARALFADAADKQAVELAKFKEAVGKLAAEQKQNFDEIGKMLADEVGKAPNALSTAFVAGASAFKDALLKWDK